MSADTTAAKSKRKSGPAAMTAQVVEAYHSALPMLPRVQRLNSSGRPGAIAKLWALALERSDKTADGALKWVRRYFAKCAADDFITGRRAPGAGHENWKATFDHVLSDKVITQIIERSSAPAQQLTIEVDE